MRAYLAFPSGAPLVDAPGEATFALVGNTATLASLADFAQGNQEYPDRSTTLILQIESLTDGPVVELQGPGIDGATSLRASIQPRDLFERLTINATLFPRGIDLILVSPDAVAALPRSVVLQRG